MAIAQVIAGARILISDLNAYYSLLKGSVGETITLAYNATGSVILQPSSDPSAGTEAIQIKNNAGTVQGSLTFDGKVKVADGTAVIPSLRFQSEATGLYLSSAGVIGVAASGASANVKVGANFVSIGIGTTVASAGVLRISNAAYLLSRNAADNADITMIGVDATNKVWIDANASGTKIGGLVDLTTGGTAMGGGAAPTVGTIGGSGPATAGQNSWLKVNIAGVASYVPVWR